MGILDEIKKLFLITDKKIENLSTQTLNTRRQPKSWVYIKAILNRSEPYTNAYTSELFYKNKRKTDIILKSLAYEVESLVLLKIFTDKMIIYETIDISDQAENTSLYHEQRFDNIDLIIHPNEKIYFEAINTTTNFVDYIIKMQFAEV